MAEFVNYWSGVGAWEAMPEEHRAGAIKTAASVKQGFDVSFALNTPLEAYTAINAPTLLVQGSKTTLAARSIVQLLADALPQTQLVEIEGAGHMSVLTHREVVANHIADHLSGLRQGD